MSCTLDSIRELPIKEGELTVWVLTDERNEYDQYGEYFLAVFKVKPTPYQLTALGVPNTRLHHVLKGGGRINKEDHWYFLREVEAI